MQPRDVQDGIIKGCSIYCNGCGPNRLNGKHDYEIPGYSGKITHSGGAGQQAVYRFRKEVRKTVQSTSLNHCKVSYDCKNRNEFCRVGDGRCFTDSACKSVNDQLTAGEKKRDCTRIPNYSLEACRLSCFEMGLNVCKGYAFGVATSNLHAFECRLYVGNEYSETVRPNNTPVNFRFVEGSDGDCVKNEESIHWELYASGNSREDGGLSGTISSKNIVSSKLFCQSSSFQNSDHDWAPYGVGAGFQYQSVSAGHYFAQCPTNTMPITDAKECLYAAQTIIKNPGNTFPATGPRPTLNRFSEIDDERALRNGEANKGKQVTILNGQIIGAIPNKKKSFWDPFFTQIHYFSQWKITSNLNLFQKLSKIPYKSSME